MVGETLTTTYTYDDNDRLLTKMHEVSGTPIAKPPANVALEDWTSDRTTITCVYDANGVAIKVEELRFAHGSDTWDLTDEATLTGSTLEDGPMWPNAVSTLDCSASMDTDS